MCMPLAAFALLCLLGLALPFHTAFSQDQEISITVYNDNLGLVKDVRTLRLREGVSEYRFQDIAAQIDPTSVYFKSRTAPNKVSILEQNYEYDLVSSDKILQKYVDHEITLSGKEIVEYSGVLLSASGSDVILQEGDGGIKIVSKSAVENMAFPKLPEGFVSRPTLVWSIDCQQGGEHQVEVGYLTAGIQWHAEYVAIVNDDDTRLALSGWVSIDNTSGADYKNAKLRLVAGDVHRARRELEPVFPLTKRAEAVPDQFQQKAFFEYHLYTLDRPATVANNQIKQIALFSPTEVPVEKRYTFDGARDPGKVSVELVFKNDQERGLGFPLPKGKLRAYKRDKDESLILIGEDFVDHTPKDEPVRARVGNAFDIVGERVQMERRSIGKESWEETWQIKLRNHKDSAVSVRVVEHLNFEWQILRNSHEFVRKDARTIEFEVAVPKDGAVTLEYVVRYTR